MDKIIQEISLSLSLIALIFTESYLWLDLMKVTLKSRSMEAVSIVAKKMSMLSGESLILRNKLKIQFLNIFTVKMISSIMLCHLVLKFFKLTRRKHIILRRKMLKSVKDKDLKHMLLMHLSFKIGIELTEVQFICQLAKTC